MKEKIRKKLGIIIFSFMAIILVFTACEKKEGKKISTDISEENKPNFVYQASFKNMETTLEYLSDIYADDEHIYMLGCRYEENKKKESVAKNYFISCGTDGSDRKQLELDMKKIENPQYITVDNQNQIYILTEMSIYNPETGRSKMNYNIYSIDIDGTVENISNITMKEGENPPINDFIVLADSILLNSTTGVYVFDLQGKQKDMYNFGDYASGIVQTEDKELYVYGNNGQDYGLKQLDLETGKFGEFINLCSKNIYKTENGYYNISICAGKGSTLYINDSNSMHCFDMESGEFTTLFNWINNDIDASNIKQCFLTKNEEFLVINNSSEDTYKEIEVASLKKVDASTIKEKTVLKLSCIYVTNVIKKNVLSFNRTNQNYRIELKDYSGYENPAVQLNLDMISGEIPDILSIDSLPVMQYIKKGVLADLYPFMEEDDEVKKEDFIDSVINTLEKDGKLYYMGSTFSVRPLLSSKQIMGDTKAWTVDDMINLYDNMPEDGMFLCNNAYNISRQLLLKNILSNQMEDYVNIDTGEVRLDSEDFIKILKFSQNFPDEKEVGIGEFETGMPTLVQTGKLMLSDWFELKCMPEIQAYIKMYKKVGGFTVLNYPSSKEDDRLSMSMDNNTLAITEKSKNKDGAWEFVRLFLIYDYQKKNGFYDGIPTRKDALETLLEYSMVEEAYVDEDGMSVEPVDINYLFDDYNVLVGPLKEEEISIIRSIIDRVGKCVSDDTATEDINEIIIEEAEAFFEGDKTAEEVAQIIQNRVKIYVSEGL